MALLSYLLCRLHFICSCSSLFSCLFPANIAFFHLPEPVQVHLRQCLNLVVPNEIVLSCQYRFHILLPPILFPENL